jgi:prepilin-type N-terminal cleavage/methylation domain-containing protein
MKTQKISQKKYSGFTLVEMMVVVAVLGILISLTAFSYNGWQSGIVKRQIQSDLSILASAMQSAKNFGSGYPTSIPNTFKGSGDLTFEYIGGNSSGYCIEARSNKISSIVYNIKTDSVAAASGNCDSVYALAAPAPTMASATSSSMVISWPAVAGASTYRVQFGTSSPTGPTSCTSSPCTISGLTASTQYKVKVTAISAYTSKDSAVINASTIAAPLKCDTGDTMSGSTCTKTYAASYNPGSGPYYTCPSGGTLSGSTCTTNQAYAATWVDGGGDFCIPPDTYYSAGVCQTPSGSLMSSESQGYTCPEGGSPSGSTCYYRTYGATYNSGTAASYYCPSGGTLSGTTCTRTYPAY